MCCSLWTVQGWYPATVRRIRVFYDPAFFSRLGSHFCPSSNYAELRYWLTYLAEQGTRPADDPLPAAAVNPHWRVWLHRRARYDVLDPVDGARVALVSYGAETEEIIAARICWRGMACRRTASS